MAYVRKKGTNSWQIIIFAGYRPDGSQKRIFRTFKANPKSTEKSQQLQAERYAGRLQAEYDDKLINDAKKKTFKETYDDYLQDRLIRRGLAKRTIDSYKSLFERELIPAFGKKAIREIEATDINRFLRNLKRKKNTGSENKKLSGTYCLKYYQQLNELFMYAQRTGTIVNNPCKQVEPPRRDTAEAQYYELSESIEIARLLKNWQEPVWKAFFSLSFYGGCRPDEIIGLDWSDFDGTNIFVQAGSYQAKGEKCKRTEKPKTKKPIRKIQLPQEAIDALKAWKKEQSEYRLKFRNLWPEPDAMVTNEMGTRYRSQAPSKAWKRFTEANGLRYLPLYDVRHTHCTLLISSRELSIEEVAARMGHEQTSTTLNIYSHAYADSNERATQALTNILKNAK